VNFSSTLPRSSFCKLRTLYVPCFEKKKEDERTAPPALASISGLGTSGGSSANVYSPRALTTQISPLPFPAPEGTDPGLGS